MTRAEDIYREAPKILAKICEAINLYLFVLQFHPYGRRRLLHSARNYRCAAQSTICAFQQIVMPVATELLLNFL